MNTSLNRNALASSLRSFHQDEEGNEMIQTVAIVAVSIMILAFAYKFVWGEPTAAGGAGGEGTGIGGWVMKIVGGITQWVLPGAPGKTGSGS